LYEYNKNKNLELYLIIYPLKLILTITIKCLKIECNTYNASLNGLPKISPKVFNLAGFSPYVRQLHDVFGSTGGWKRCLENTKIESKIEITWPRSLILRFGTG